MKDKFFYSIAYLVLLGIPSSVLLYLISGELDKKALFLVLLVTLGVGGVFDIWATRQGEKDRFFIWEYNSNSILGFKFYGVPVEDFIFFLILTPVFIISIYEAAKKFLLNQDYIAGLFTSILLIIAIFYYLTHKYAIKQK